MWSVAVRPRWIAALVIALAVAGGFAALGQWQLARSVDTGVVVVRQTERVVPLNSIAQPQAPVTSASTGQRVRATGAFVPGDAVVLSDRVNFGETGFWVVGHLAVTDGAGVAVALGWTDDRTLAESVAARFGVAGAKTAGAPGSDVQEVVGRYVPSEAPQETDFEAGELGTLSVAALINSWNSVDSAGVYGGYIVATSPADGLDAIESPAPAPTVELNWLNVFYAAEWVIFAGFAIFLWWRLVKDAWEKENAHAAA